MLYLAQVHENTNSGNTELELLAEKKSDNHWEVCKSDSWIILMSSAHSWHEGILVLVSLDEYGEVIEVKDAKEWLLSIISSYLTGEVLSPEFIEKEKLKIENWRRELTIKSKDITCLHLEIETRREQLQELEITLKQERERVRLAED